MSRARWIAMLTLPLSSIGPSACVESDATLADGQSPAAKARPSKDPRSPSTAGSSASNADGAGSAGPSNGPPRSDRAAAPSEPSTGCRTAPLSGDVDWSIASGGRARSVRIHLPPRYDGQSPVPLLLNYHGRMSSASQQELLSGTTPKADAEGFIVAYPTGVGGTWNGGMCCGQAQSENVDDVAFTRDLLDAIDTKLCVDRRRVFATGLSNGAFMVQRLACELSDRIAAIAPVAGPLMMTDCRPTRPVPVIEFHGTADAIVPYGGTLGFFGVESSIADWAKRNGCRASGAQTYANGDTTCTTFGECNAGANVTLCTTTNGGHQWPGGLAVPFLGAKSDDIRATDAMWRFFAGLPLTP